MLFRLVRFFHPASILHIGQTSGLSLLYLTEADDKATCTAVADEETLQNISMSLPQTESDKLANTKKIGYDEFLSDKSESIGFAFLNFAFAEIAKNEAALDKCIKEAEEHSVVVITDIHANPRMKRLWEKAYASTKVSVGFDLRRIGILLFDKNLNKHLYKL